MVKRKIIQASLLSAFGLGTLGAREIRTPLNLQYEPTGHFHMPIVLENEAEKELKWDVDIWGGGYAQNAGDAFGPCDGMDKVPLAELLFGQATFLGKQLFANNTVSNAGSVATPFLNFATLKPLVEYNEEGIVVGINATRRFLRNTLRAGVRVNLPFRVVEMRNNNCGCSLGEETVADVSRCASDYYGLYPADPLGNNVPAEGLGEGTLTTPDCAYRLDFLASLASGDGTLPFVHFGTGPNDHTTFGATAVDVPDASTIAIDANNTPAAAPAHVLQEPIGVAPFDRFAAGNSRVNTYPTLDGAGVGPGNGNRAQFKLGTDYTALASDPTLQSKFWVVPTFYTDDTGVLQFETSWGTIQGNINNLLSGQTFETPSDFLAASGISFATEKHRGVGDLETAMFLGWEPMHNLYGELVLGIRWPTGDRIKDPANVYSMATGNNGHYEFFMEQSDSYQPINWFGVNFMWRYNKVFKRTEKVAASFVGSTIKNINPTVDAEVQWQYGLVRLDLNFFHPTNPGLGFLVGYEFYGKSHDDICFVNPATCDTKKTVRTTAPDLFGNLQTLDACVLEMGTAQIAHKMRLEFFHHWNFADLFMGWTQVIAGKNVMHETAWDIGMVVRY